MLQHFRSFFAEQPWNPVRSGSVQTAVGRQKSERRPALIQIRRRCALKPGDIMAPEGESAHRKGQPPAQRLCHGGIGCHTVPAPVNRELLGTDRRAAREQDSIALSPLLLKDFKDTPVVEQGIIIVHRLRIRSVVVPDIYRDPLSEVRLEAVDSHSAQPAKLLLEPGICLRVGKVHDPHAIFPVIGLPDSLPVRPHQKVSPVHRLVEQRCVLRDIWIHPDADLYALFMIAPDHPFRVRELSSVPFKITQAELPHPIAVIVKNRQRNIPFLHSLDK